MFLHSRVCTSASEAGCVELSKCLLVHSIRATSNRVRENPREAADTLELLVLISFEA